jgi:hypothetical protein
VGAGEAVPSISAVGLGAGAQLIIRKSRKLKRHIFIFIRAIFAITDSFVCELTLGRL